jgi:hypothetical protein
MHFKTSFERLQESFMHSFERQAPIILSHDGVMLHEQKRNVKCTDLQKQQTLCQQNQTEKVHTLGQRYVGVSVPLYEGKCLATPNLDVSGAFIE